MFFFLARLKLKNISSYRAIYIPSIFEEVPSHFFLLFCNFPENSKRQPWISATDFSKSCFFFFSLDFAVPLRYSYEIFGYKFVSFFLLKGLRMYVISRSGSHMYVTVPHAVHKFARQDQTFNYTAAQHSCYAFTLFLHHERLRPHQHGRHPIHVQPHSSPLPK